MAKKQKGRVKVGVSSGARNRPKPWGQVRGAALGANGVDERSLPALEGLAHVPAFGDLVPTAVQRAAFEAYVLACGSDEDLALGFVCRLDRNFPAVQSKRGLIRAEHAERIFKGDLARPVVGDWVVLRAPQVHDVGLIEDVLPRQRALVRWRGNKRGATQVLAANVDSVLVAQPVGRRKLSLDRIYRSAVVAADCGSAVGVLLTKADRAKTPSALGEDIRRVREVLGSEVAVVALAAATEAASATIKAQGSLQDLQKAAQEAGALWGIDAVREVVAPQQLALLLGESGAGKSTLINAFLGDEVLQTEAVRANDDAGRHTTVARRMVKLPHAGVIIDCPGLRSLPLVGHERGLGLVFPEIAQAAQGCKFSDCTHHGEPGCAVEEGFLQGRISLARLSAYLSLAQEMRAHKETLDPDVKL